MILELNKCFLSRVFFSFLEHVLVVFSGVLYCRGSEKEDLVHMVNLLIYLINLDHVASLSSVVGLILSDGLYKTCLPGRILVL